MTEEQTAEALKLLRAIAVNLDRLVDGVATLGGPRLPQALAAPPTASAPPTENVRLLERLLLLRGPQPAAAAQPAPAPPVEKEEKTL